MARSRRDSEAEPTADDEGGAELRHGGRSSAAPAEGLTVEAGKPFAGKAKQQQAKAAAAGDEELPPPPPPPVEVELVDEATVRSGLQLQGSLVHGYFAVDQADEEWVWLAHELDTIAPPLTRIVNRYPVIAAAAAKYGDPAVVAGAMAEYAVRSMQERAAAVARLQRLAETEGGSGQADWSLQ